MGLMPGNLMPKAARLTCSTCMLAAAGDGGEQGLELLQPLAVGVFWRRRSAG